MITIEEAKERLEQSVETLPALNIELSKAAGMVLAKPVYAAIDSPPFDKSAMDGFALTTQKSKIKNQKSKIRISQVIKAGDVPKCLEEGTCAKIMTGAMIPEGADAVVPKEDAIEETGCPTLVGESTPAKAGHPCNYVVLKKVVEKGQFIRKRGGEVKKGELLLPAGHALTPASVGLLASHGIINVSVFRKPTVAILITGDEIVRPSSRLVPPMGGTRSKNIAQIFDANFFALSAGLSKANVEVKDLGIVGDNISDLRDKILEGLKYDILIISGGVSVGEFDYIKNILHEVGIRQVFWQVAQKPGKPLYFGIVPPMGSDPTAAKALQVASSQGIATKGSDLMGRERGYIFGLPGNPAAALVCLYEYILPTIKKMMGHKDIWSIQLSAKLSEAIGWERDRTEFVRGIYNNGFVTPIPESESHMLKGFADANCLIVVDRFDRYDNGEKMKIHLI